ncbi:tether containing UBX domain for GLUT4 isoform X2 [Marmota marmota marmota]|nr:tether containing UBX domain for GLUT4 isoform X2 [Marmota marmota marmota]
MRDEVTGGEALRSTTLQSLGLTGGSATIRFVMKQCDSAGKQEPGAMGSKTPGSLASSTSATQAAGSPLPLLKPGGLIRGDLRCQDDAGTSGSSLTGGSEPGDAQAKQSAKKPASATFVPFSGGGQRLGGPSQSARPPVSPLAVSPKSFSCPGGPSKPKKSRPVEEPQQEWPWPVAAMATPEQVKSALLISSCLETRPGPSWTPQPRPNGFRQSPWKCDRRSAPPEVPVSRLGKCQPSPPTEAALPTPTCVDVLGVHLDFICEKERAAKEALQLPVDRDPVVCHPDLEDLLQAWPAELPDEFFEVTVDDVRRRLAQLKSERKRLEEAPLVTRAFREAQMKEKLERYPKVVLRVLFPDRYILQGFFRPSETVGDLRDFVRSHLGNPQLPFHLFVAPPRTVLDDHTLTLFQANLFPAALVHFGAEEPTGLYLEPGLLEHTISPSAADVLVARCMSRATRSPLPLPTPGAVPLESEPAAEEGALGPPGSLPGAVQPMRRNPGKVPKWLRLPASKR